MGKPGVSCRSYKGSRIRVISRLLEGIDDSFIIPWIPSMYKMSLVKGVYSSRKY